MAQELTKWEWKQGLVYLVISGLLGLAALYFLGSCINGTGPYRDPNPAVRGHYYTVEAPK